jgi:hypothetical protein
MEYTEESSISYIHSSASSLCDVTSYNPTVSADLRLQYTYFHSLKQATEKLLLCPIFRQDIIVKSITVFQIFLLSIYSSLLGF